MEPVMNALLKLLGLGLYGFVLPLTVARRRDPLRSRDFDHERRYGALTDVGACRYYERRPLRGDD
jgi:hypothetical protein